MEQISKKTFSFHYGPLEIEQNVPTRFIKIQKGKINE